MIQITKAGTDTKIGANTQIKSMWLKIKPKKLWLKDYIINLKIDRHIFQNFKKHQKFKFLETKDILLFAESQIGLKNGIKKEIVSLLKISKHW